MKFSKRELIQQIATGSEGDLSPDEVSELDALLVEDPEARKMYLRYMQMHSLLETFPPDGNGMAAEEAVSRGSRSRSFPKRLAIGLSAAAGLSVIAIVVGTLLIPEEPHSIATLIFAGDCEWATSAISPEEGERLSPGELHLMKGTAVIRFDRGAEMVISDHTELRLISTDSARLTFGEVVIRAEEGSEGFRLDSPSGEMTDLGTEFTVRVRSGGETELHVHEGEVATEDSVVAAGRAVRMKKAGDSELLLDAPRFQEVVQRANPGERRDLMTAYEGFFTDRGVYAPEDLDTGKGWEGPWRLRTPAELGSHGEDTFPNMSIGFGKLDVAWPIRGGQKGMLEMPPGRNIRTRQLSHPISFSEEGITYFSFLAGEVSSDSSPRNGREDFRITFRSSEDYFGESLSAGWTKHRRVRIQTDPGAAFRSIREIPGGETVFCVGKIIHSKRLDDQVQFRFYRTVDSLDFVEPAEWDVETRGLDLSAKLDLLLITSIGQSTRYVDEIRIGPTWRSVTPIDMGKMED